MSEKVELPPLDVTEQDTAIARQVFSGRPTALVPTRETQDLLMIRTVAEMLCRERQLLAATAERDSLKAEVENLRLAGQYMSNMLYNLAQQTRFIEPDKNLMKECITAWDGAVLAYRQREKARSEEVKEDE